MANRGHPHRLPLFFDFINNPIDVSFLAVKQMPQLWFQLSGFQGGGAAGQRFG
jgi:hypothetical protein